MHGHRKLMTICSAAVLALGLAACGSSSDDDQAMCPEGQVGTPPACEAPPTLPTAYETAKEAIQEADTAEAAQVAYDAAQDNVSGTESASLRMALNMRLGELAAESRAETQKTALMTAAGMIDTSDLSTQEAVNAARMAIAGLREALTNAADVSDADKAMYQTTLTNAANAVDTAQGGIDTETRRTNQMGDLMKASGDLQAALAALSGKTPTQAQLDAANNALTALNGAITDGVDLTDTEKAPYQHEATNAAAPIQTAQNAFDKAEDDADKVANAAMAVLATKLYAGISAPTGDATNPADDDRAAAYNTAGTAILVSSDADLTATGHTAAVTLSEDKKASVDDNYGWAGKKYTAEPTGDAGTYEAVVYSNVADPMMGEKFSTEYPDTETFVTGGVVTIDTTGTDTPASRIALTGVTRTTGTETFKLPDPNPKNEQFIPVPGSFHGVSGTYSCDTGAARDQACTASVAEKGFTLTGTWTFKPDSASARVTESADPAYSSYGWWLHKSENGETFTASAFHGFKGTDPSITALPAAGTARYMGGAAGKYALRSSTGGTNDAGHFTARAVLDAEFGSGTSSTISGTIDMFRVGDAGEERNWEVELMKQNIGATGTILGDDGTGTAKMTKWTIDETPAKADGQWSGNLRELGTDGVPRAATGTFYSTYGTMGNDGSMVGAFGATYDPAKQ